MQLTFKAQNVSYVAVYGRESENLHKRLCEGAYMNDVEMITICKCNFAHLLELQLTSSLSAFCLVALVAFQKSSESVHSEGQAVTEILTVEEWS